MKQLQFNINNTRTVFLCACSQELSGLTEFELARLPRTVRDVTKHVNQSMLKGKFTCPVCLCIVRKTTTVMACLHRFCEVCINSWLRAG